MASFEEMITRKLSELKASKDAIYYSNTIKALEEIIIKLEQFEDKEITNLES